MTSLSYYIKYNKHFSDNTLESQNDLLFLNTVDIRIRFNRNHRQRATQRGRYDKQSYHVDKPLFMGRILSFFGGNKTENHFSWRHH